MSDIDSTVAFARSEGSDTARLAITGKKVETAVFGGAIFRLNQARGGLLKGLTTLTLLEIYPAKVVRRGRLPEALYLAVLARCPNNTACPLFAGIRG